jgi:lysophospholipase L1-like esterase
MQDLPTSPFASRKPRNLLHLPSSLIRGFRSILLGTLAALTGASSLSGAAGPTGLLDNLPPHTTIGILGDSITQGVSLVHSEKLKRMVAVTDETDPSKFDEGGIWHQYLQLFFATRHPGRDIWTINIGQSGDSAAGVLKRMEWDVLSRDGDLMLVMFGMNDVGYTQYMNDSADESFAAKKLEAYRQNLAAVVDRLLKEGRKVVVATSTPYEDREPYTVGPKLHAAQSSLAQAAEAIAKEKGVPFIDFHDSLLQVSKDLKKKNPKFKFFTGDRVHPHGRMGFHEIMAYEVLKQLGAPGIVYEVTLTAGGKVLEARNAEVLEAARSGDGGLRFSLVERALPFPVSKMDRGFSYVPFQEEFNRQFLKVTELASGNYDLLIDGTNVGTYTAEEFAAGISLSQNENTPQYKQAADLYPLVRFQKLLLEQQLRVMENNLYHLLSSRDSENFDKIDWKDPMSVHASLLRVIGTKNPDDIKAWEGYVLKTALHALPRKAEIEKELADIRKTLASLPSVATHEYALVPAGN